MKISDDMVTALADGELEAEMAADLRRRIAKDPERAAFLAKIEASNRLLRDSLDPGPVPQWLIESIAPPPPRRAAKPKRRAAPWLRPALKATAMAASLALAFALGSHMPLDPPPNAASELAALTATMLTGSSQSLPDGRSLTVLASYHSDQGLCRTVVLESALLSQSDVICEQDGDWAQAFSLKAHVSPDYLPASDLISASLTAYLHQIGAGAPLSLDDESAALNLPSAP